MSTAESQTDLTAVESLNEAYRKIRAEIGKVIIGQDEVVDQLLVSLLAYACAAGLVGLIFGPRPGWLAVVALLCLPRFWGHAFFNFKDIPFAAGFTAASLLSARIRGRTVGEIHRGALETVDLVGTPVGTTEVQIRDEQGNPVGEDQEGEICVRGRNVMTGYFNRPAETRAAFWGEWLRTGDVGRIDADGYLFIVDRLKDMILVSGFNVYPNEVEEVLAAHPGVLEAGVIGVSDEKSTEAVRAIVVPKDPGLTEQALHDYAHENLSAYKCPKSWVFVDELPKSNVGKILRRELREMYGK